MMSDIRKIDQVFVNGRIWTGDQGRPSAEAIAIAGDRIVFVGSTTEVLERADAGARRTDLEGRRVLPGFNDAHWHFWASPQGAFYMAGGLQEFQRRLKELADNSPHGSWIANTGWAYADFPGNLPHRKYIDAIVPDRPVWIDARDGHMGLANTKALELAGITRGTVAPPHSRIECDADGELTGEFKGIPAMKLVTSLIPPATPEEVRKIFTALQASAASHGITSVQNLQQWNDTELEVVETAAAQGQLKTRIYAAVTLKPSQTEGQFAWIKYLREKHVGPLLKFGCVKTWLDGTIDARTALMREEYVGGGQGESNWSQADLNHAAAAHDRAGLQLMLHATGDGATGMALEAFEYAQRQNGIRDARFRIEHIDIPTAEDLTRLKAVGGIASSQPNFAYPDETVTENYSVLLGPERAKRAEAFKDIDDAGLCQPFGSDYPVSSMDTLRAIHTAMTRTLRGVPGAKPWQPHQRISLEAALRHFTQDGAYASFDEHEKGTLSPGKLADFVVLSEDIFDDPERRLLTAQVAMTVMGGAVTYQASQASPRAVLSSPFLSSRDGCPHCRSAAPFRPRLVAESVTPARSPGAAARTKKRSRPRQSSAQ
jgi:predicted amidohydrolase YtcJ